MGQPAYLSGISPSFPRPMGITVASVYIQQQIFVLNHHFHSPGLDRIRRFRELECRGNIEKVNFVRDYGISSLMAVYD